MTLFDPTPETTGCPNRTSPETGCAHGFHYHTNIAGKRPECTYPGCACGLPARGTRRDFDGETYEREHDQARLSTQLTRTIDAMIDGEWRTLDEVSRITGDPEASISARLRDLRKPKFGSYHVERRSRGDRDRGHYEYRVTQPTTEETT